MYSQSHPGHKMESVELREVCDPDGGADLIVVLNAPRTVDASGSHRMSWSILPHDPDVLLSKLPHRHGCRLVTVTAHVIDPKPIAIGAGK